MRHSVTGVIRRNDDDGKPYSVLEVDLGPPFHYMASTFRDGVSIHCFRLSTGALRELSRITAKLADELQDADKEQPQRPIEDIIT
jgi:hypothetical protein